MEKKPLSPIAKGFIILLPLIAFALITTFMGIDKSKGLGWIQYLIILTGIVWACISYSKQMEGNVTFGNLFAHGFKVSAVITSLFIVYMVVSLTFIFPEIKEKTIEIMRAEMAKQPDGNSEQAEKIIGVTKKYFVLFTAGGTLLLYLFLGAVSALVGAAVAKKNPNPTPFG